MSKKDKPTQTKPTVRVVGTNSNKLPWPQDNSGSTQELRRGAVRAIGRIMGSEDNLKKVLETLEVARLYAIERMEEQQIEMKVKVKAMEDRKALKAELLKSELRQRVKSKRAEIKRVESEIKKLLS